MKDIVETLTRQHRAIEEQIAVFDDLFSRGQLTELSALLGRVEHMLQSHFKLEERELFPALLQLTEAQPELNKTIALFQQNSGRIVEGTLQFFEKRSRQLVQSDLTSLQRDWTRTIGMLTRRIGEEEQVLHPLFRKLSLAEAKSPQ